MLDANQPLGPLAIPRVGPERPRNEEHATDILRALSVEVHCPQCGDFTVGADIIAESQRLLAAGCPGSPHECPPTLFATLLPQAALESLERVWNELESAVRAPVRQLSFDVSSHEAPHPDEKLDPRILSRWEDDGGYIPRPPSRAVEREMS